MPERIEDLFGEYAEAYARGERPQAREFLARANAEADELARLIDLFLARAPAPAPDEQTVQLFEAWQTRESPLARFRAVRGLNREAVALAIVQILDLDPKKVGKVERYYGELEAGQLEPGRVDRRVWEALAQTLGARIGDLLSWRPRLEPAAPAFASASHQMMTAMRADVSPEQTKDEIDRLFGS